MLQFAVRVLSCSNLRCGDRNSSDPFVVVKVTEPHEKESLHDDNKLETRVIEDTLEPVWEEDDESSYAVLKTRNPFFERLYVSVRDKDTFSESSLGFAWMNFQDFIHRVPRNVEKEVTLELDEGEGGTVTLRVSAVDFGPYPEDLSSGDDDSSEQIAALRAENDGLAQEKNALEEEKNLAVEERDALIEAKDAIASERDALVEEKDGLVAERDALAEEKDGVVAERDALAEEKDAVVAERDSLLEARSQEPPPPVGPSVVVGEGEAAWVPMHRYRDGKNCDVIFFCSEQEREVKVRNFNYGRYGNEGARFCVSLVPFNGSLPLYRVLTNNGENNDTRYTTLQDEVEKWIIEDNGVLQGIEGYIAAEPFETDNPNADATEPCVALKRYYNPETNDSDLPVPSEMDEPYVQQQTLGYVQPISAT